MERRGSLDLVDDWRSMNHGPWMFYILFGEADKFRNADGGLEVSESGNLLLNIRRPSRLRLITPCSMS